MNNHSTKPVIATGAQLKAAREALGWSLLHIAAQLGVHEKSVRDAETKSRPSTIMVDRLQALYSAAGVEFTNGDAPWVTLRQTNQHGVIAGDKLTAENDT